MMRQPMSHVVLTFIVALILGSIQTARADLGDEWAKAKYQTETDQQLTVLESLMDQSTELARQNPDDASVLLWQGTISSTYASTKGGLSVLKIIDSAKVDLEKSIALNENIEGGLAHVILGAMYYRVPGWPISFKDYDAAEHHLKRALALNPQSIDANFFYGDFLKHRGDHKDAATYFKAALEAPIRPTHQIADEGRRQEAKEALEKVS